MNAAEHSLLGFLDTPVLVGDPEGRAVYANPAFEARFVRPGERLVGRSLSEIFAGGGREAVLSGVARACEDGETARFQVREGGVGYSAVASPIVAKDDRVGVVILLQEEVGGIERLVATHREMRRPLEELSAVLEGLFEQTGGRRAARYRSLVEDGLRSLVRLRRGMDEIAGLLAGSRAAESERFDPAAVVRRAAEKAQGRAPENTGIFLLAPPSLPIADGDPDRLAWALVEMMELRLSCEPRPRRLTLGARRLDGPDGPGTLVSIVETFADGVRPAPLSDPSEVQAALADLGAPPHVASDPRLGRATVLRLSGTVG